MSVLWPVVSLLCLMDCIIQHGVLALCPLAPVAECMLQPEGGMETQNVTGNSEWELPADLGALSGPCTHPDITEL